MCSNKTKINISWAGWLGQTPFCSYVQLAYSTLRIFNRDADIYLPLVKAILVIRENFFGRISKPPSMPYLACLETTWDKASWIIVLVKVANSQRETRPRYKLTPSMSKIPQTISEAIRFKDWFGKGLKWSRWRSSGCDQDAIDGGCVAHRKHSWHSLGLMLFKFNVCIG